MASLMGSNSIVELIRNMLFAKMFSVFPFRISMKKSKFFILLNYCEISFAPPLALRYGMLLLKEVLASTNHS